MRVFRTHNSITCVKLSAIASRLHYGDENVHNFATVEGYQSFLPQFVMGSCLFSKAGDVTKKTVTTDNLGVVRKQKCCTGYSTANNAWFSLGALKLL